MRVNFRLKPGRDDDLIRWLETLPDDPGRSFAIRKALREKYSGGEATIRQRQVKPRTKDIFTSEIEAEPVIYGEQLGNDDLEAKLDALF